MHTIEKVDLSVLPEKAQEELYDFPLFLKQRYKNETAINQAGETVEHKAWQTIIENNKKRKFYVDPSVDIRALIDEASLAEDWNKPEGDEAWKVKI